MKLESSFEVTEEEVEELLEMPEDFACDDECIGATWTLGPCISSRDDANALQASNSAALQKHLESDETLADQWYILRASHWGHGWVEHLAFRVLENIPKPECTEGEEDVQEPLSKYPGKQISRICRVIMEWNHHLKDCVIADEEDFSRRQLEQAVEYVEYCARWDRREGHKEAESPPAGWAETVYRELDKAGKWGWEGDGSPWVRCLDMEAALVSVGALEKDVE